MKDRCPSVCQPTTLAGAPMGPPRRCTRKAGHPLTPDAEGYRELHEWMRPGRRVRWPDSAAEGAS